MVLNHAVGAAPAGSRLLVELLAEGVDEEGVLLFRDGSVVAGEGFGCGVLDAEASRYLGKEVVHLASFHSHGSPCERK